jgi:hypothetical protein
MKKNSPRKKSVSPTKHGGFEFIPEIDDEFPVKNIRTRNSKTAMTQ